MTLALLDCPIPVIAAVNGAAFGGGCELALTCDFAYASTTARFALTEITLGIMPGAGGTQFLPRAVGSRRAKEIILTGKPFSAQDALEWGVVNKLCAPDKLMDETLATAQAIANNAPIAVRQAKRSMHFGMQMDLRSALFFEIDAYNKMVSTEDRLEGVRAFNEKRKPNFKGKVKERTMAEFIEVREVGLRDGIQNIKTVVPTDLKLAWIKAEVAAGVRDIEVCSFVPPKLLPQFADAEEVTQARARSSRAHRRGADAEPEGRRTRRRARRAPARLRRVGERGAQPQQCAPLDRGVARGPAAHRGFPENHPGGQASAPAVRARDLVRLHHRGQCAARPRGELRRAGRGDGRRRDRARRHGRLRQSERDPHAVHARPRRRSARRSCSPSHFHDTRGLGIANVAAAIEVGVRHFDASLCGLGGCPFAPGATGNIVTEDVVFLAESLGFDTGIDLDRLIEAREIVQKALPNEALYGQMAKAGLPKGFAYAEGRKAA